MLKQKIILDCDPGHDDAVAIMLAGNHPSIDLLGISVVSGNQTLEKTALNALHLVEHLGLDVPVYVGCDRPMIRPKLNAGDIHGETGMDGPVFEPIKGAFAEKHAVQFIIDTLMESDGDIIVVTCGPMTNLGMALRLQPKIAEKIKRIVLMGGTYQLGNVTPAAEFNIVADADAAHVCFSEGIPITMVGLDVTRKVLCYPSIIERMNKINNKASKLFCDLMTFFNKTQKEIFGWEGGPLHDPLTLVSIINPDILKTKPMNVKVDIRGTDSYGRTNCDYFDYMKLEKNADVGVDVDVDAYWDVIEEALRAYGA